MTEKRFTLGDSARDRVSGFEGVLIARVEFLNGCTRYELQPPVDEKGKHVDPRYFDEEQLERTAAERIVAHAAEPTGGDHPDPQGRENPPGVGDVATR